MNEFYIKKLLKCSSMENVVPSSKCKVTEHMEERTINKV